MCWIPANAGPRVVAPGNERYQVIARIGSCSAQGLVNVNAVPYPHVSAGPDMTICYRGVAHLNGITDGSRFYLVAIWPVDRRQYPRSFANLLTSTAFVLTAYDDKGCPKPSYDTVMITVLPKIVPFGWQ